MFNKYVNTILGLFFIGTIDQVVGQIATVELTGNSLTTPLQVDFPTTIFPCEVSEGDQFYVSVIDGVAEIRCGEPD